MLSQLHIVPNIAVSSGGLGLAALRYAEHVSRAGAKITLMTASCETDILLERSFDSTDFCLVHVPYKSHWLQSSIAQYRLIDALCEKDKIDLIHLHGAWLPLFWMAVIIARRRKIPYVVSPHGSFEPWALKHKFFKKYLALLTYQGAVNHTASLFFATAEQEVESIRRLKITQPIIMIPNGVDITTPPVRVFQDRKRTILFLSRIHPIKGLIDLVEAWAKVRNPAWKIVIAGPDENGHQAEVQSVIEAHGLNSDFEFIGLVEGARKAECFANAEIFILPTYSENFGIAVAEALAYELPVITTTGAPWKDLENYRCGWWVPPGVSGISKALKVGMETDSAELRLMGKRGRELVLSKFTWEKIGRDALRAYTSIVRQPPSL